MTLLQAVNSIFIYFVGDSTCGQRALYQLGLTGIPIYNVSKVLNVKEFEKIKETSLFLEFINKLYNNV